MNKLKSLFTIMAVSTAMYANLAQSAITTYTWNLPTSGTVTIPPNAINSNPTGGPTLVSAKAYANTGAGSTIASADLNAQTVVGYTGGLGVTTASLEGTNPGAPQHALDNNGAIESILFIFSQPITLSQLNIGYVGNAGTGADGDLSVLAYTKNNGTIANATTFSLVGTDYGSLTNQATSQNGFTFVQNSLSSSTGNRSITTAIASQAWLVSAYSNIFNGSAASVCAKAGKATRDCTDDFVKLASLTGTFNDSGSNPGGNPVPEPATLLLIGAGLPLLRRKIKSS